MKLRKRFWGVIGSLTLVASQVTAGGPDSVQRAAHAPKNASVNQQVAAQVAAAIASQVPDRGYTVNVEFRGGTATLRGNVSSPAQLHGILQAARSQPQVRKVVNELQVATEGVRTVAFQTEAEAVPAAEMRMATQSAQGQVLTPASPEFTFPQGAAPQYDAPFLPPFAWPAKAPYPNISAVQYPKHYTSTQWPHIGPFHPYPEPPLDWRKVRATTLSGLKPINGVQDPPPEWHCFKLRWEDGHWYLSFKEPWWARRGFLNSLCDRTPDDLPIGCEVPGGCGYHIHFHQPLFTHMFMN
jgi:hypothetical protein